MWFTPIERGDNPTHLSKQSVKNLCSGYSYCFSLLGTFYTWYGCGSVAQERQAALAYAQEMASPSVPIELTEGENDDDEMFWMMLGEREYAQADHWKWKASAPCAAPRVWSVKLVSPRDVSLSVGQLRSTLMNLDTHRLRLSQSWQPVLLEMAYISLTVTGSTLWWLAAKPGRNVVR